MDQHIRTASCACGALSVTVHGEPHGVYACACSICQRRSGSVFTYTAMYEDAALVKRNGPFTTWRRTDESGFWTEHDFCSKCGSRVVVRMLDQPGRFGISVGAFGDPDFQAPEVLIFSSMLHRWLPMPEGMETIPSFSRT
jgi:hypothetical protein